MTLREREDFRLVFERADEAEEATILLLARTLGPQEFGWSWQPRGPVDPVNDWLR